MKQGFFITGTDTNAGKTWASLSLMQYFKNQGRSVVAMKPVASGCIWTASNDGEAPQLKNDDALLLQAAASVPLDYGLVNPYAYELPVSPHLAGADNPVDISCVLENFNTLKPCADIVLVEGAGGWYAPINATEAISDLACALGLPVVLVVAVRLGCINQARLSYEAIARSGVPCAGWIANCVEAEMAYRTENIQTLERLIGVPLLGVLPYCAEPDFRFLAERIGFYRVCLTNNKL